MEERPMYEANAPSYPPPPITGYRTLSQEELDAINAIKAKAEEVGNLVGGLRIPHGAQVGPETPDQRWVSIGATHLQEGFMALIRSIAKPTTF